MEDQWAWLLIGGGVIAALLLVVLWPTKSPGSAAEPRPRSAEGATGSAEIPVSSSVALPALTRSGEAAIGLMEQSAADLAPRAVSPPVADAMVTRDGAAKRLGIKVRPSLLPGTTEEQYQVFVDIQKHWIREVVTAMRSKLAVRETDHFLLVTDADKALRDYLKQDAETRYRELIGFFCLPLNPGLWDGKLSVFVFLNNDDYKDFATRLDGFTPRVTETGYVRIQDRMAHVVLRRPFDEIGLTLAFVQHLTGVMCHYLAGGEALPRWVLEGLVIFLQTQTQVGQGYREGWYRTAVKATTFHGEGINMLLTGTCFLNPNPKLVNDALACSFALVELLVVTNHPLFIRLLAGIKQGGEPETLIRKLYGEKITHIWQVWESQNVPASHKAQMDDTVRKALAQLRSLANPDFEVPSSSNQQGLVREITESRADLSTHELRPLGGSDEEAIRDSEREAIRRRLGLDRRKMG